MSQVPPAIRRERQLRAGLADAHFHLKNAERALEGARDGVRQRRSDEDFSRLVDAVRRARAMLLVIGKRERLRRAP